VTAGAGLKKQFAFSSNAAGGQSTALGMVCLPGNLLGKTAHSGMLEIPV